jgi:predicted transposase YbfD/YdcC
MDTPKPNHLTDLINELEKIRDPRINRHKIYPLNEILFLCITSVMSGMSDWEEMVEFGKQKLDWLRKFFPYANGISSHDTLNRVFGLINHREFEEVFISWINGLSINIEGHLINIDGKKLRGSVPKHLQSLPKEEGGKSAVHLVEAWCSKFNLCLGQYKTEDKSNEITAIPALLDLLDVEGCLISIDAMGCQKDIAQKILDKKANYLLSVKDNQAKLHQEIKNVFDDLASQVDANDPFEKEAGRKKRIEKAEKLLEQSISETLDHGRFDTRQCRVLSAKLLPEEVREQWPGLEVLIEVYSQQFNIKKEKHTEEYRYYIGSQYLNADRYNSHIRGHWGIENKLHWIIDVQMNEDQSTKQKNNSAQNFGLVRRMCLNMLKNNGDNPKVSINRRMGKCVLSDQYRENTLKMLNF